MYEISKRFTFSAAHQLSYLPPEHKCSRLHGHNYVVIVTLACSKLNEHGFVLDYAKLDVIKQWINEKLDHRNLNDIYGPTTSAEQLAFIFFGVFRKELGVPFLDSVTVSETENTTATYREGK